MIEGEPVAGGGKGKWKQKAWTPARCAIWQALKGSPDRQAAFENWVGAEPEFGYPEQVSADWQAEAEAARVRMAD